MPEQGKVRTVLVGCGGMSGVWLNAVQKNPDIEIIGLVDVIEEMARQKASEFHLSSAIVSSDIEAVLHQTEPDAIFNCTVPDAHYEVTMQALKNGCHVLSEKPLADSMEHALSMISAAKEAGKILAVIQNRRYDPNIRRAKQFLASRTMGALTTVNSDFYVGPHFGGFRDRMEHVLLLDMAIHSFDAARLLTGADPVSVYCKEWNPRGSWYDHDASAVAIFEMTNDIVYTYRGSWCAEGLPTSWECDWRFIGQQGSMKWDGGAHFQAQIASGNEGFLSSYQDVEVPTYQSPAIGGHAGIIKDFINCVQNGAQPETNAQDNIKSLAMVLGAIESAEKGYPVKITW